MRDLWVESVVRFVLRLFSSASATGRFLPVRLRVRMLRFCHKLVYFHCVNLLLIRLPNANSDLSGENVWETLRG